MISIRVGRRVISFSSPVPSVNGQGQRVCVECGDLLDPIDWCVACQTAGKPCGRPHRSLRRRANAVYCGKDCRSRARAYYRRRARAIVQEGL